MEFLEVNKILYLNGMMRDVTEWIQKLSVFEAQNVICTHLGNLLTGSMALCAIYTYQSRILQYFNVGIFDP